MSGRDKLFQKTDEEVLNEEVEEQVTLSDEEKETEKRNKGEQLWTAVQAGETKHLITKVASILNRFPETRNSDVALMTKYWEVFQGHEGDQVSFEKLFELERLTSIARTRAKIQNEYGLFQADKKYRRYRQSKEEIQKEYEIATKPAIESIDIYADESGKNDDFAIVGSIWILAGGGILNARLADWSQEQKQIDSTVPNEFHFNKIKNNGNNILLYKDFFNLVMSEGHMSSFKAIAVNKTKITKPIDEIITELFYQLVRKGVEHDKNTGRIGLPKQIKYFKDKEDGESALRLSQIQQSLIDNFKLHYEDELTLNAFMSIDSRTSRLIQVADLFTGAINRRLNHQRKNPSQLNAKDEFASYVYDLLNIVEISSPSHTLEEPHDELTNDQSVIYVFD
ncbi:MAG: DUF3800 domain-containing protein [Bacillota bacterium]